MLVSQAFVVKAVPRASRNTRSHAVSSSGQQSAALAHTEKADVILLLIVFQHFSCLAASKEDIAHSSTSEVNTAGAGGPIAGSTGSLGGIRMTRFVSFPAFSTKQAIRKVTPYSTLLPP